MTGEYTTDGVFNGWFLKIYLNFYVSVTDTSILSKLFSVRTDLTRGLINLPVSVLSSTVHAWYCVCLCLLDTGSQRLTVKCHMVNY